MNEWSYLLYLHQRWASKKYSFANKTKNSSLIKIIQISVKKNQYIKVPRPGAGWIKINLKSTLHVKKYIYYRHNLCVGQKRFSLSINSNWKYLWNPELYQCNAPSYKLKIIKETKPRLQKHFINLFTSRTLCKYMLLVKI